MHTIGTRVTDAYDEDRDIRPGDRTGTVTGGQDGEVAVQWDDGAWTTHRPERLVEVKDGDQ